MSRDKAVRYRLLPGKPSDEFYAVGNRLEGGDPSQKILGAPTLTLDPQPYALRATIPPVLNATRAEVFDFLIRSRCRTRGIQFT